MQANKNPPQRQDKITKSKNKSISEQMGSIDLLRLLNQAQNISKQNNLYKAAVGKFARGC